MSTKLALVLDKDCHYSNEQHKMLPPDIKSKISICHINGADDRVFNGEVISRCDNAMNSERTPAWTLGTETTYGVQSLTWIDNQLK